MPPVFIYTMPAVNSNANQSGSGPASQRTTFRPPWVKEGPNPLPMPAAPWTARNREVNASTEDPPKPEKPTLRKQSKISIIPSQPAVVDNDMTGPEHFGVKLQPVSKEKEPQQQQGRSIEITTESKKVEPKDKNMESKKASNVEKVVPIKLETKKEDRPAKTKQLDKMNSFSKSESKSHLPPKPPAPPLPPPPPPPPGKSLPLPPPDFDKKPITPEQQAKLESLRSRPRRRPDWTDMMKEVEMGQKLKHVQCNDRSAPVLPKSKAKGQFVYESEKDNAHNILLKQIQNGVSLKKVKTNDRSKPILDGLRKFRRQMTIEEQIQKSASVADVVAVAAEPDELDDIDKVRDDLQSTKQMLALELRNKEALERENKRLMARLLNLEVELEKEKAAAKKQVESGEIVRARTEEDEKLVQKLKEEAAEANTVAKEMEDKYRKTAEELDATRAKLETAWLRNQQLELDLKQASQGVVNMPIMKQPSSKKLAQSMSNGKMLDESEPESEYEESTETESESDEEDPEAAQERRTARELKLLTTKLRSYKEKRGIAQKERNKLKEQLKKQQKVLKEEKKKYKILQKEVDKMAKLMKDVDDDEEEEEEEEDKSEDDEEEEESDSESETEESESEEESEGDLPEDASPEDKKQNLTNRAKKHENRLSSLKKGNYLLKANIDRVQDDINRQREMSLTLQEDLNSVLAELG